MVSVTRPKRTPVPLSAIRPLAPGNITDQDGPSGRQPVVPATVGLYHDKSTPVIVRQDHKVVSSQQGPGGEDMVLSRVTTTLVHYRVDFLANPNATRFNEEE